MTFLCVRKHTIIASDNDLLLSRRQAIIRTEAGILLIWPSLRTNFFIEIHTFSFKKTYFKMSFRMSPMLSRPQCINNSDRLTCDDYIFNIFSICRYDSGGEKEKCVWYCKCLSLNANATSQTVRLPVRLRFSPCSWRKIFVKHTPDIPPMHFWRPVRFQVKRSQVKITRISRKFCRVCTATLSIFGSNTTDEGTVCHAPFGDQKVKG